MGTGSKILTSVFLFNSVNFLESLSPDLLHLLLTIIALSAVAITIAIIFARKRRAIARELTLKKEEIEEANHNLEKLNNELLEQKEKIADELADSELLYRNMLSAADDAIILYNPDWSVRFANPALHRVIGYEHNDMYQSDIISDKDFIHPDDNDFYEERARAIKKDGYYETVIRVKHRNGRYIVLSTKVVQVKNKSGSTIGILSISRDITSLKDTEEQLIMAKEKAEESNRLKSTFLANISHEIRTPLNSIVGFANLLNDFDSDPEIRLEYLSYLNQNTEKLLQIITDIIDLSRLENDEIDMRYNPVNINSALDYAEDYVNELIKRSGKEIIFSMERGMAEGRDTVYSDDMWLRRVFRQLLDNAVKFTRSGNIEIKTALVGSSVMFAIKDTGIGISKENIRAIFEQFRQEEDGHHRSFEGLGIGLTMARKVIEKMDGYLWVESEKGKGSEFFFTIPYRPVDKASYVYSKNDISKAPEHVNWSAKTVLVVDDNLDILRYLSHVLKEKGITVMQAMSGQETIDIIKNADSIDLILLDMQMPGMNGLEAMQEIRKIRNAIPIVAQTAFIFEGEQDELIKAGCDACLIKPINENQLLSVLAGFLSRN